MMHRIAFAMATLTAATAEAASSGALTQAEASQLENQAQLPAERPERHVVLMPVVGIWNHSFEQNGWTAKPSPVWGLDVKIEPFAWLGVRANALRGNQRLEIGHGLLVNGFDAYQPTLQITQLGIRVEPTLQLSKSMSAYLGFGVSWGRFIAPETVTAPRLHSLNRTAVHVGYEGALGIAYEPRRDRVVLDLSIVGVALANQSGSANEATQAFTDSGHRLTLGGMSKFSGAYRVMFGIGFVL